MHKLLFFFKMKYWLNLFYLDYRKNKMCIFKKKLKKLQVLGDINGGISGVFGMGVSIWGCISKIFTWKKSIHSWQHCRSIIRRWYCVNVLRCLHWSQNSPSCSWLQENRKKVSNNSVTLLQNDQSAMSDKKYICVNYVRIYRYASTWFVMDVASTIPFELLAYLITRNHQVGVTFSFLGMLRFWRLRRVKQFFTRYIYISNSIRTIQFVHKIDTKYII